MTYASTEARIGVPDLTTVVTSGNIGTPGNGALPSVTTEVQLGQIVEGFDSTQGCNGKFIYLAVPTSTTVTPGLLYQYDKNYRITVVPVKGTAQKTGVSVVAGYNTVSSNASSVQYTWFCIQGSVAVLKTAVAVSPQSAIYISGTAGRFYVTSSAGGQVLGARTNNTATISAAVSSVLVILTFSALEGA